MRNQGVGEIGVKLQCLTCCMGRKTTFKRYKRSRVREIRIPSQHNINKAILQTATVWEVEEIKGSEIQDTTVQ